ncbi:MAG: hypothetical protein IVW53_15840 [Chloroflexi bacterium]|nr:hypothetical protein [Chloroflexota bacterium]
MTTLISIFGIAGRFAGALLTTALGWASSLLFGRVPRSHQIFVILMLAGSVLWIVLLLGFFLPIVARFLLDTTPHPAFIDSVWLGVAIVVGLIILPLFIGVAGYLVPAQGARPTGLAIVREILRGYPLALVISVVLVFLPGVGIVRKVGSLRRGWSDTHIPIVVKPGGYDRVVADLQLALSSADLLVTARDAPSILTVPGQLLARVAGGNVRALLPDHLVELNGQSLEIGVYPSDIAISGARRERTRARAAILSRLATTSAHLTTSAESQAVEDRLERLAGQLPRTTAGSTSVAAAEFAAIDATLLDLDVATHEWDLLYRLRLQVERDGLAGTSPGTAFPGHGAGSGRAPVGVARSTGS